MVFFRAGMCHAGLARVRTCIVRYYLQRLLAMQLRSLLVHCSVMHAQFMLQVRPCRSGVSFDPWLHS
jgi:hypothetical protein